MEREALQASPRAGAQDPTLPVRRQGHERTLRYSRVTADSAPPRGGSQGGTRVAEASASCPTTVTNQRGDRIEITCPYPVVLNPGVNGGYWTGCAHAGAVIMGELSAPCFTMNLWDAKLKKDYVPPRNTLTQVVKDACGTVVSTISAYNLSGGWPGTPDGYLGSGLMAGFIYRVGPYVPMSCFGTWTITITFTETFSSGKTLTASATDLMTALPTQGSNGYGTESYGGGNGAELGSYQASDGDPVNTATGNHWQSTTDLAIPGRGPGLVLGRTYNSRGAGTSSSIGYGWTLSYGMKLRAYSAYATVTNANGSETEFQQAPGSTYIAPPRMLATLVKNGDGSWTYTVRRRTVYAFDSSGRLTRVADLNGYATTLSYNGAGQLASASDGAGRSFTFSYNGSGQLVTVTDSSGRSVSYGYDGSGNLTTVTNVRGHQRQYTYDSNHLLLTVRDANGNVVLTSTYDSYKRVLTQKDAINRTTTYSYSDCCGGVSNETTRVTDPRGFVTEYVHDVAGQLVRETQAAGTPSAASWTYTYDPYVLGRTSVTDPNNHTRSATYDQRGNLTSTTSALGRTTTMTYDSLNDLTSFKDGKGTATTYTYDARGNVLSLSTPHLQSNPVQNQTVTYTYGDASHPGDVTSVRDPNGKTTTYTYDAAGNLASVTNPVGGKTTYSYDAVGRALTTVSPRGNAAGADPSQYTTRYTYDAAGNRLSITDPLGHETHYTYANNGNLLTAADANTNETTYTYDDANQLTEITRADGSIIKSAYDANGNLASQTDAAENMTRYEYDAHDHQISVVDPLNRTTNYSVDAVGNVRSMVDPQTRTTNYTYNADDELTGVAFSDGTTPNANYGYDDNGSRTSMTDGTGTWSYTYDSLRRLTNVVNGRGDSTSFDYDIANNQTSITYPNGKTVTRTFDNAERVETIRDWLGNTTTFDYTPDSQLASVTFPTSTGNLDTYNYNNAGQTVNITIARGSTTLASIAYQRDSLGQVQGETAAGLPGTTQTYGYDQLNRLVSAGSFAYDVADNPTTLAGVSGFTYDAANQLQSSPSGSYAYGALGQRTAFTPTSSPASSYTFDQAGRLTSVGGAVTASYGYDGDGLRAAKTVGATTRYFTWDQSNQLPRLLSDGAASYIYGPDGTPLEQIDTADNVRFYHHDQLGSTRLLTDTAGDAIASFTYEPYGSLSGSTGTATTPVGFAGQYTDAETGLIYMRARYYDPATAQFLSRDPIEQATRQAYGYVSGNPLNAIDPSGLSCWSLDPLDCARAVGGAISNGASDVGHAAVTGAIGVGNYAAGLADGMTAGYSTKLLNAVGIRPDTCSALYQGAIPMGLLGAAFVPGLGELRAVQEGIYIIRTARGMYVGQSGVMSGRLARHGRSGRFTQAEADAAERIYVPGGRVEREIAEQQKIDELGGIDNLLNERNPIGPARFNLMPPGYKRP